MKREEGRKVLYHIKCLQFKLLMNLLLDVFIPDKVQKFTNKE